MKPLLPDLANVDLRPSLTPEERLLLAVVESAYWDLQSSDTVKRRVATAYFLDDRDQHTFSFVSICQHFSWSPGSIRFQLGSLLNSLGADEPIHWESRRVRRAPSVSAS